MSKKRATRPRASRATVAHQAGRRADTGTTITIGLSEVTTIAVGAAVLALVGASASGALPVPTFVDPDANTSLWIVFLMGLSVGGLSCLAVQGGLLAAMIAQRDAARETNGESRRSLIARGVPVIQFVAAKIAAYAVLGAALGYFGSKIPMRLQGALLIAAGVFMVIVVLQMFDVHPFFRRFSVSPPRSVRSLIRGQSRRAGWVAPFALGASTVFIPCGVTLAMEAVAIASNSPARGALVMTAFTLGSAPLFLALGLAAAQLSRSAGQLFRPLAALSITAVAGLAMLSGARLLGLGQVPTPGLSGVATAVEAPAALTDGGEAIVQADYQEATVHVATGTFDPPRVQIQAGRPTLLHLVTENTRGCIRAFVIPALGYQAFLPETGTETVELPAFEEGRIDFMCSMGMYTGVIEVVN